MLATKAASSLPFFIFYTVARLQWQDA